MAEIRRVLKSQGRLFATTIGQNHLKEIANWIRPLVSETDFVLFGSAFTLENGLEQLKPFFAQVTLARYPDHLQVTHVEPILAFIRSTGLAAEIAEQKLAALENELERELKENGKIFIRKDSGLFEAVK